jgi:RND family efflux transporter MFP subunit
MPGKNGKSPLVLKLAVVLVAVVAAAWLALISFRATAVVAAVKRDTAVDVVTGSVVVHADGDLKEVKSEADGRVAWSDALDAGRPFKQGDVLVRLDSEDLQREIKQAEADHSAAVERRKIELRNDPRLQLAKKAADDATRMHNRGEISDQEFDKIQREFETLKTKLDLESFDATQEKLAFENAQAARQRALERMTIHAPVDGVIQGVNVYPGALISKGATVATYYSTSRDVVAKVSEDSAGKLAVGQRARVRLLNYGSREFDARVTRILPFADADTQRYTAFLQIDPATLTPEKLIPFGTGEVTITVGEHPDSPLVPRLALFSGLDGYYVFVVKDGRVEKRKVEVGFVGLNLAEVKKFLAPGELVIVSDLEQFRDGQHVRTTPVN